VERILLDKKLQGGARFYLVKWEGFSIQSSSWLKRRELWNCELAVSEYKRFKKKIRSSKRRLYVWKPKCNCSDDVKKEISKNFSAGRIVGEEIKLNRIWDGFPEDLSTLEPSEMVMSRYFVQLKYYNSHKKKLVTDFSWVGR
jgi:hypothetical protein